MGAVEWKGKRDDQHASIATIATEFDYVKTFGLKLLIIDFVRVFLILVLFAGIILRIVINLIKLIKSLKPLNIHLYSYRNKNT